TTGDIDRLLDGGGETTVTSVAPGAVLDRASQLLDQGRYDEAATLLGQLRHQKGLSVGIARARLALRRGDVSAALPELTATESEASADPTSELGRMHRICAARAHLRRGDYARASELAEAAMAGKAPPALAAEALSIRGLAGSYTGRHDDALKSLEQAVSLA